MSGVNKNTDEWTVVSRTGKPSYSKKKHFFFGMIDDLAYAFNVILMVTLKTIQYGQENNLNEKFVQVQMIPHKDCGIQ